MITATPDLAAAAARLSASTSLAPGAEWNLSQTVQHCAQTIGYSVTGYPKLKPALVRATIGALIRTVFLRRGAMRHPLGAEIDGAPPLLADLPLDQAIAQLTAAVTAFEAHSGPHPPHPTYGTCTHTQFARLHAMHLADHLPGLNPI